MFSKTYLILKITRTKILVSTHPNTTNTVEKSYPWKADSIKNVLEIILSENHTKNVRVLFQKGTFYSFIESAELSDEDCIKLADVRIPELFTSDDIRITLTPDKSKKIITVPVQSIWKPLRTAFQTQSLEVDLFCSDTEALMYGSTSEEGLANVKPSLNTVKNHTVKTPILKNKGKVDTSKSELSVSKHKTRRGPLFFVLSIAMILLLGVFGLNMMTKTDSEPVANITPTVTPTATPTIIPIDLSTLSIEILNSSGRAGAAGEVASLLNQAGILTIDTANGPTTERGKNTIAVKEASQAAQLIPELLDILKDYEFDNIAVLLEDGSYDLQVIIGK